MNNNRHWTESFRIFTPILVTIACFMLGSLMTTINKIDDKMFKHLTNDEIHCPRSIMASKGEFDLYQKMRDTQMKDLKDDIGEIKKILVKYIEKEVK